MTRSRNLQVYNIFLFHMNHISKSSQLQCTPNLWGSLLLGSNAFTKAERSLGFLDHGYCPSYLELPLRTNSETVRLVQFTGPSSRHYWYQVPHILLSLFT